MGEINRQEDAILEVFKHHDVSFRGELTAEQMREVHADMRLGGISLPQVRLRDICSKNSYYMYENACNQPT